MARYATTDAISVVSPTITVDTAIYAALDVIGAAAANSIVEIAGAVRVVGGTGVLESVSVFDDDNEKAVISLLFFNSSPSGGTYNGNGALALAAGDKSKYLGKVNIAAADYETIGGEAFACIKNVGLPVQALASSGSTSLFMIPIVTSGTPTYTAATDLKIVLGFTRN